MVLGMVDSSTESSVILKRPTWDSKRATERDCALHFDMQLLALSNILEGFGRHGTLADDKITLTTGGRQFPTDTVIFVYALLMVYKPKGQNADDYRLEVVKYEAIYGDVEE
ncbi:hypothetical protein R3P38DRAFT_3350507 [Favolaschia claudopus]|uniref:Uncharacterized protein n=1 Tax=Favolaschia claudopus TaxID=2862362 RepID=A0AAW0CHV2_9AGAR